MLSRHPAFVLALLVATSLAANGTSAPLDDGPDGPLEFDDPRLTVQYHAVENQAEMLFCAEADRPLRRIRITGPNGLVHRARVGRGARLGLGDVIFETAGVPLDRLFDAYPEGTYRLSGRTLGGRLIQGEVELRHDMPPVPLLLDPAEGDDEVPMDHAIVRWFAAHDVEAYELALERRDDEGEDDDDDEEDDDGDTDDEDDTEVIRVKIPKDRTSFQIPAAVLEPGTDYTLDLVAIGPGGNRTLVDRVFSTAER